MTHFLLKFEWKQLNKSFMILHRTSYKIEYEDRQKYPRMIETILILTLTNTICHCCSCLRVTG